MTARHFVAAMPASVWILFSGSAFAEESRMSIPEKALSQPAFAFSGPALIAICGLILAVAFLSCALIWQLIDRKKDTHRFEAEGNAKTHFLFSLSREMRTPLSAIIGMNDLAMEKRDDPEALADCLNKISISSRHLLRLVNDGLDLARIADGTISLSVNPFDFKRLLRNLSAAYQAEAEKKGIALEIDFDGALPAQMLGDEARLKQILMNLLSNAVSYNNPGGKVRFSVRVLGVSNGRTVPVRFEVEDTGYGISPEILERIRNPFDTRFIAQEERVSNAGLGLTIARQIAELMGSDIEVESESGKGSRFWLDVTMHICPGSLSLNSEKDVPDTQTIDLSGEHILMVDDSEINALIVKRVAEVRGASVDIAGDGKQACELFEASPINYYQVILMDIRMPLMDGYAATHYIRSLGREDARKVVIMALSSNSQEEDIRASLDAGMDLHLIKPLENAELLKALNVCRTRGSR